MGSSTNHRPEKFPTLSASIPHSKSCQMLGKHNYDPTFFFSSIGLKKILKDFHDIQFRKCLDLPCGNGRNIFFLSTYFETLLGVDLNQSYLDDITNMISKYKLSDTNISTKRIDLLY